MRSDNELLRKIKWTVMVIDEAQNIKNHGTSQSKAARQISAVTHIAMSGTPVENRLTEFWSIMEFANKGYLGSERQFKKNFANPIQRDGNRIICDRFRAITSPFMMRRLKTDKSIISDLPDKIERNEYIELTPNQAALYQSIIDKELAEITTEDDNFRRSTMILKLLTSLKQVCNHPAQFLKNGDHSVQLSGKAIILLDMVQAIVESKEKVLIFTQYREMGDLLVEYITERIGRKPLFYHGGCTVKQRNEMVDRFQNTRNDQVFILSLKAAGTGLNLTAATNVIHYDLWWNPAVEAQATDRAYRIGQHKNVQVCRFITKGTFEEKIDEMIQHKRTLADMTVSNGESWIGNLTNSELNAIFVK
jgi:SNF2 family DNA or RNA helicase